MTLLVCFSWKLIWNFHCIFDQFEKNLFGKRLLKLIFSNWYFQIDEFYQEECAQYYLHNSKSKKIDRSRNPYLRCRKKKSSVESTSNSQRTGKIFLISERGIIAPKIPKGERYKFDMKLTLRAFSSFSLGEAFRGAPLRSQKLQMLGTWNFHQG